MRIHTIGFTKKTAEHFFGLLRDSGATTLVDVRLNNVSQLAGFAKRDDLRYFVRELCGMEYAHRVDLAPTQEILDGYRKGRSGFGPFEKRFVGLMAERRIQDTVPRELLDNSVLLCGEESPEHCHRRLVAEYLARHWEGVEIRHLV
ncbi:DUF488 domain-containing protein [Nocardia sp. NPDC003482]